MEKKRACSRAQILGHPWHLYKYVQIKKAANGSVGNPLAA